MQNKPSYLFPEYYKKRIISNSIEHAYLLLLEKDYVNAENIFQRNDSPRAKWGACVAKIFQNKPIENLTFFQIANFLEIDVDFFIKNNISELFLKNIINYIDNFLEINCFVYKYLGRVFYANNMYEEAIITLKKSLNYCYKDLEVHFLIAKLYLYNKNIQEALISISNCIKINKEYFPAKKLLKEIEENKY